MNGGCIWWNDGSGRFYNLRYEYIYVRTEFEPLPKDEAESVVSLVSYGLLAKLHTFDEQLISFIPSFCSI